MSKTHDYSGNNRGWGHDYCIVSVENKGRNLTACGWGYGLEKNDFIILDNDGETTRYAIAKIEYYSDPTDMWKAELVFYPRIREVVNA